MTDTALIEHHVNMVCDTLFGKASKPQPTTLEDALVLAKSLAAMLLELKHANPDSANLEEAEDMACSIVIDLSGEIRNCDSANKADLPVSPFAGMSHLRATGRGA